MGGEDDNRPEHVPHELVYEILTRLDVKSLTRFRSVSTRWNSTIVHPSFSKSHLSRSPAGAGAPVTLVLSFINRFNSERTIFSVKIPPNQTRSLPNPTHILTIPGFAHPFVSQSLNGLICFNLGAMCVCNPTHILTIPGFAHPFVSQSLNGLICFNLGAMCVCNPSTRKFLKLPWTKTETPSPSPVSTHHRRNAFGFDPVSNAHKVLDTWITYNENEMIMEHKIFTVGSGCDEWRRIADGPPYFPFNESICINGQIYFRALTSFTASEEAVMVAFDVNREVFRFIQMRDDAISDSEEAVLIELDGRLAIVHHEGNVLMMWVLIDEEDAKWVKKRVEIPAMYSEINDRRRFKFAGTTFSGDLIFAEKSLVKPFSLFIYNIKKNEARKIEICGLTDFNFDYSTVLMNVISVTEHVETIKCLT